MKHVKAPGSLTVDNIIEKLPTSKNHFIAVMICALGFMFDSFDTYIIAYAMPLISKEWGLDPVVMGTLNSAGIGEWSSAASFAAPSPTASADAWALSAPFSASV